MYALIRGLMDPYLVTYFLIAIAVGSLWWRRSCSARRLTVLSGLVLLLGIASTPLAGYLAIGSLEWRYPPPQNELPDDAVIVVLGGAVLPPDQLRTNAELAESTLLRCVSAATLYHQLNARQVILSGGMMLGHSTTPVSKVMHEFLLTQGVRDVDMVLETESQTTFENAVNVAKMLGQQSQTGPVVLVTDASHLRRAQACFSARGIATIPAGARYRATSLPPGIRAIIPDSRVIGTVGEASYEWIGLMWYWMTGKI